MAEREHNIECPACGETGVATLPDEVATYGCPANCGARFVKYRGLAGWAIRWVVVPVFRRPADSEPVVEE